MNKDTEYQALVNILSVYRQKTGLKLDDIATLQHIIRERDSLHATLMATIAECGILLHDYPERHTDLQGVMRALLVDE